MPHLPLGQKAMIGVMAQRVPDGAIQWVIGRQAGWWPWRKSTSSLAGRANRWASLALSPSYALGQYWFRLTRQRQRKPMGLIDKKSLKHD
jgi:hypothetical protein